MDFDPTEEQSLLIDSFDTLYSKWSTPELVREAEPMGFSPGLWAKLAEIGALEMAVPADSGGGGASLLDLELVAERHGHWLAPVPMIESQVALRLLHRIGGGAADELVEKSISGEQIVTIALHPVLDETLALVPGGAVADVAIALQGDRLLAVPIEGHRTFVDNLGNLPLADIELPSQPVELASGAAADFEVALNEWMTLTSGALAGLAARALEIGVSYAKERQAFGAPIGSFQGVAHPLADAATARDGALLLAREAAWSAAGPSRRFGELASLAFAFATESARDASYRALHFHGGYGFMMEYDIQLFFRRAKAWPAILMEPRRAYELASTRRRMAS
jgi:alkylation response protein AidB-like acyl-CoA dehydrogenase